MPWLSALDWLALLGSGEAGVGGTGVAGNGGSVQHGIVQHPSSSADDVVDNTDILLPFRAFSIALLVTASKGGAAEHVA